MNNSQEIIKTFCKILNLQNKIYFEDEGSEAYNFLNNQITSLKEKISLIDISKEKMDICELIVKKQNYLADLENNQRTDDYMKPEIFSVLKNEIETTINELTKIVK